MWEYLCKIPMKSDVSTFFVQRNIQIIAIVSQPCQTKH